MALGGRLGFCQTSMTARNLLVVDDGSEEEDGVAGVAWRHLAVFGRGQAAVGRQVRGLGLLLGEGQVEQGLMALAGLVALVDAALLDVDVILELDHALGSADPDGAGGRRQGVKQPFEQLAEEASRRHVGLAQPSDLIQEPAQALPFLVHVLAGLTHRSRGHGATSL